MAQSNRQALKRLFKKGSIPKEKDFADLIDSTLNIVDDGIDKSSDKGLILFPKHETDNDGETVLSVAKAHNDPTPQWKIAITQNDDLEIRRCADGTDTPVLLLKSNGAIVLGNDNHCELLNGAFRSKSREGTLFRGCVAADGEWHDITGELSGMQVLEAVVYTEETGSNKQSVLYAIATCCAGKHGKISLTRSYSRFFSRKIRIRWKKVKSRKTIKLQVKSAWKSVSYRQIRYHITGLVK